MILRLAILLWATLMTATLAHASQPLTPERVFASPALSGPTARGVAVSPDGRWVTWLKAAADNQYKLDLWLAPITGGEAHLLVAGKSVGKTQRAPYALVRCFSLRQRQRHARPAVGHIAVRRCAVRRLQPVFHVPDLVGDIAHGQVTNTSGRGSATMACRPP